MGYSMEWRLLVIVIQHRAQFPQILVVSFPDQHTVTLFDLTTLCSCYLALLFSIAQLILFSLFDYSTTITKKRANDQHFGKTKHVICTFVLQQCITTMPRLDEQRGPIECAR